MRRSHTKRRQHLDEPSPCWPNPHTPTISAPGWGQLRPKFGQARSWSNPGKNRFNFGRARPNLGHRNARYSVTQPNKVVESRRPWERLGGQLWVVAADHRGREKRATVRTGVAQCLARICPTMLAFGRASVPPALLSCCGAEQRPARLPRDLHIGRTVFARMRALCRNLVQIWGDHPFVL